MLTDELLDPAGSAVGWGPLRVAAELEAARRSRNYGDATFMDDQLRMVDLIPRRVTTFVLLFLTGLIVVAALELLYSWASTPAMLGITSDGGPVAAFDLDSEGSLAVWFSSVTLFISALVAVLIYAIRRFKTDDYQGYYRIWLWAAACWLLMSVDETASLHEGFKEMMKRVTGTAILGDGSIWWVAPYFFLLGAVGSRLLFDMRECRSSSTAFVGTAICFAVAVLAQLGWILPEAWKSAEGAIGVRGVMLEEGAEMVGNLLLLLAMGLHARYVIFDAEGLLPEGQMSMRGPVRRSLLAEAAEVAEALQPLEESAPPMADEWIRVESAHETLQPPSRRAAPTIERNKRRKPRKAVVTPKPERKSDLETSPPRRKLTKAERKAMRKRMTEERVERERRKREKWN